MAKDALPIRGIRGNIIFTPNDAWACYYVRSRSYRSEPMRRKINLARELMGYARMVEADFQVLRVSRRFDPDLYVRNLRDAMPAEAHSDLWSLYLAEHHALLSGLEAWTPAVFICVRLAEPTLDFQGRAARLFERTPRESLGALRAQTHDRRSLHGRDLTERARTTEARIRTALDARAARYEEVQWLVRRAFCRGIGEPAESPEEAGGVPHEEPERAVRRWFLENGIRHSYRYLESTGEHGESFQAGLCLGEMGHAGSFTRQVELMFTALDEYPWPIDASLNVRFIPNDQALRRAQHQVARTKNQLEDEEQAASGARGEGRRRVDLSEEFHDRLSATGEPILDGTLSFMLASDSHDELEHRVRAVREGFPWPLYRPVGDQLGLWKQHLPGQPSRVRGYERPFTIEQIGAMVPHGTHEAGSSTSRALYIARTVEGKQPVFFDLREGSGTNKSPTIGLIGSPGGGKTMFLQLLLWQAFMQGARIVDVDPKGDHRFHELPEVAPHTQRIFLGPDPEHAGKLDPLRVAPVSERHDAAATFLIDVLPEEVGADAKAAISGAISRVLGEHGDRACCMAVVESLENGNLDTEKRAGHLLRQYCEAGIVRLGFAKLEDPLPSRAESQVVYLNVRALKRSGLATVRSEMTQSQRHGRAVLQLVALYAMRILGEERERMKILAFDEASFLTEDALGQQLLDTLTRWARSELAVPILSSQLLGDVDEQDNLIGHWFLFAMKSRDHAVRALDALELDASGPLADALTEHYGGGRALYRDLVGRSEEIQIDLGRQGLLEALSTTPSEDGPIKDDNEPIMDEDESITRLVKAWT